ncbi:glycosyltransferase family 4 protein [Microbulbifer sp. 2205BS26-8]|uniref:glycosyltransferase family 4 protein n=1 Tax=Microbulbifer sp. 2205BS26-8 TaxID=3064386 RepID=UPI00273FD80F|nr:glycosyltransferase family 4 protein [Microbulbifer sp. 2205BS26-8]MDP5211154.1 glycosyltransferase family 4 protein [Microbulbifer sp. 2205BS26-8]
MKILYAYRYGIIGGVYSQLALRRDALQSAGFQCELFFSQDNNLGQVLKERDGIHFGAEVSFRRLVQKGRFDIIIVIDSPELLSVAAGPLYRRNTVYLDVHTTTSTGLAYLIDINPVKLAGITVPTNYSAKLVTKRLGKNTPNIQVLPNILQGSLFAPDQKLRLKAGLKIKQYAAIEFVWVGKLDHHKNWRLALVYTAMLQDQLGNVRLSMVGGNTASTSQSTAFFELAYRLGISERVSWIDRIDNFKLVEIYRQCAATGGAMLVTSRDESFGMAASEALLCGCPLITNDLPVFREIYPDSSLISRVDIWNPNQVVEAATTLLKQQERDEVINLHCYLAEKYSPEAFINSFKGLIAV